MIDFDRLLKLRLVVARVGEMDLARWWNTRGMLGRHGAVVLQRGLPRTHRFAQARVVFAVARSRCHELFDPPGCMTLWHLPAEIEDRFEDRWQAWLDEAETWTTLFERLQALAVDGSPAEALLGLLRELELVDEAQVEVVGGLRRSAEGRSLPLPGVHRPDDDAVALLAAGFSRGEPGKPAIPYARLEA